jgi:hypothetical protein
LNAEVEDGELIAFIRIAEIAEKPLYRVTCGDIGTDAEAVETVCGPLRGIMEYD